MAPNPSSSSTSGVKRSRPSKDSSSTSTSTSTSTRPLSSSSFSSLVPEGDFPRGGATGLTPLEYRQTLREARAEATRDEEDHLFNTQKSKDTKGKAIGKDQDDDDDQEEESRKLKRKKMNRDKQNAKRKKNDAPTAALELAADKDSKKKKEDHNRIEHLNYKVSRVDRDERLHACQSLSGRLK